MEIFEHEILEHDLDFYICLFFGSRSYERTFKEITQFSVNDEKKILNIIVSFERISALEAINNYSLHIPVCGLPSTIESWEKLNHSTYISKKGIDYYGYIPEHVGRVLDKYPAAVDSGYTCGFWTDVNKKKINEILEKNAYAFKNYGNIRTSNYSYKKQREKIVNYFQELYKEYENPLIRLSLKDPILSKIDVLRTINALSCEKASNGDEIIEIISFENKRDKWVDGIDDVLINVRCSDYLLKKFCEVSEVYNALESDFDKVEDTSVVEDSLEEEPQLAIEEDKVEKEEPGLDIGPKSKTDNDVFKLEFKGGCLVVTFQDIRYFLLKPTPDRENCIFAEYLFGKNQVDGEIMSQEWIDYLKTKWKQSTIKTFPNILIQLKFKDLLKKIFFPSVSKSRVQFRLEVPLSKLNDEGFDIKEIANQLSDFKVLN